MAKKIKDSDRFVVGWGKHKGNPCFFVCYKDKIDKVPVEPIDLARFLVDSIKKIEWDKKHSL